MSVRLATTNRAENLRSIAQDETNLLSAEQRELLFVCADHIESLQGQIVMHNRLAAIDVTEGGRLKEILARLDGLETSVGSLLKQRATTGL